MATLARLKHEQEQITYLDSDIPAPFPLDAYRREQEHLTLLSLEGSESQDPFADQNGEDLHVKYEEREEDDITSGSQESVSTLIQSELAPSLVYVQQTCLMTLNNLLSGALPTSSTWQPILPPRRHSMPSRPEVRADNEPSSAMQILVANLRNSGYGEMIEASSSTVEESALLNELHQRVELISHDLTADDAHLTRALISLLAHVDRLSRIDPALSPARLDGSISLDAMLHRSSLDLFGELSRQVLDLQAKRQGQENGEPAQSLTTQTRVEMSLLWKRIDQELEAVSQICRHRNEAVPRPYSPGQLPPEYEYDEADDDISTLPPEYDHAHHSFTEKEKPHQHSQTSSDINSEKMRMDLESVTMAIDRLYLVAPQLHNQRVELRKSKVEELERARLAGSSSTQKADSSTKGKEKQNDVKELEKIIELVDKVSSRRLDDQSVVISGDIRARLARATEMDKEKREAFVEHLAAHSDSRRIVSQDAVLDTSRVRNPNTLLTLPEFIKEPPTTDETTELNQDPNALLTFSEMVKEMPQPSSRPLEPTHSFENLRAAKKHLKALSKRSRSISAPPLAWLLPSLSRSPSSSGIDLPAPATEHHRGKARSLLVRYVAEYHEHLSHVLVFVGVDEGIIPGVDLEGNVIASADNPDLGGTLVLKCGPNFSPPLSLPVPVPSGVATVQVQGSHYEIKFPVSIRATQQTGSMDAGFEQTSRLLDAEQIADMNPTSFICASCSSGLIQTRTCDGTLSYSDLPSEYWSELLEAWMCHSDQKLSDRVAKYSQDLWPKLGQVLVGGSYFLFDESAVAQSNLKTLEMSNLSDEWKRVLCICGAIIGRCRIHSSNDAGKSIVYRIPKYAVRLVSLTAEPSRIPFSAFVLEDMLEIVKAHATYRFIISDEEEERPRLLIWLFKPHIQLSYATTAQYTLPKTGSIHASKILFKILRNVSDVPTLPSASLHAPSSSFILDNVLEKYPGFPQAERLLYPRDICHRLATLLRESNTAYPFGVRVMTGLLTGWLGRE